MNEKPWDQLVFLRHDIGLMINGRWWRVISVCFSTATWIIVTYRCEQFLHLLLRHSYGLIRIILLPLFFITRPWRGNYEIHYRASIGKGLKILHPELGIVINGNTIIGEHLTLTGGNCIGAKTGLQPGDIKPGNNVSLGANAVILGPIDIGNDVMIGAGAVVVHDASDGVVLVGIPAKPVDKSKVDLQV